MSIEDSFKFHESNPIRAWSNKKQKLFNIKRQRQTQADAETVNHRRRKSTDTEIHIIKTQKSAKA